MDIRKFKNVLIREALILLGISLIFFILEMFFGIFGIQHSYYYRDLSTILFVLYLSYLLLRFYIFIIKRYKKDETIKAKNWFNDISKFQKLIILLWIISLFFMLFLWLKPFKIEIEHSGYIEKEKPVSRLKWL